MKKILSAIEFIRIALIFMIICFAVVVNAQSVAINTNGTNADNSAMLDVSSSNKGFLTPRMTTAQRTAIASPANGLLIFDTDTKTFWFFSTTWKEISNGGGGFSLPYSGSYSDLSKLFSITNTNTINGAGAIYGKIGNGSGSTVSNTTAAIWGDNSSGWGVVGSSNSGAGVVGTSSLAQGVIGTSANSGFAGVYGVNSTPGGIGVMGVSSTTSTTNGSVTALNQSTGNALYAESTGGGTAVYGKTTKSNGAAIYGINNAVQGHAIRGAATGNDGVAIYGEAGNSSSSSYAGYFRNSNAANSKNVVQIDNLGTGNFLSLTDGLGDTKVSIAKNGNINTDGNISNDGNISTQGTISVKGNKGIVRSSTSTQMRFEVIPAVVEALGGNLLSLCGNCTMYRTITFPTPFGAPPAVSLANLLPGGVNSELLDITITTVTSTSCTLRIENNLGVNLTFKGTWNLIAIGQE